MAKKNSNAPKKPMVFNSVRLITSENVKLIVDSLPKNKMSENAFNAWIEQNYFFDGKYQGDSFNKGSNYSTGVRQLGLYQIKNSEYIPRFSCNISNDVAESFLKYWLKLYVFPNPTSQNSYRNEYKSSPKYLLKEIISYLDNNHTNTNIYDIVDDIFNTKFSRNDKGNLLQIIKNYSECINIDSSGNANLKQNYKSIMQEIEDLINNPNRYFEHFGSVSSVKINIDLDKPLQQIFYGAPGTGKSHRIDGMTNEKNSIRTTFHPDSDYSSFVGSYKPMMDYVEEYALDSTGGSHKIQYNGNSDGNKLSIVYNFEPQAFLKAYVEAWSRYLNSQEGVDGSFYLVIEEINRGNCAQIFGDIFQLLDRGDNGFSNYAILPDSAISKYLADNAACENSKFSELNFSDVTKNSDGVTKVIATADELKSGKKLVLPPNLFIWATMNTSDQSLFPMDSAFKRRWEWEYVKVDYNNEVSGKYTIKIGDETYKWHTFLEAVNAKIKDVTKSEDKQMGNFFIKGDVDAKAFCNKVMFYLWNDVSKDYYESNDSLFQYIEEDSKPAKHFSFNELFGDNQTELLMGFMKFIGCKTESKTDTQSEEETKEGEQPANE